MNESDLAQALMDGELAAAGLDVLAQEPMSGTIPLRCDKGFKQADYHTAYCVGKR